MNKHAGQLGASDDGKKVTLRGWVKEVRDLKKLVFLILRDRTGDVQIVAKPDMKFYNSIRDVNRESVVQLTGVFKASEKTKRGFEIIPDSFEVLNPSAKPLPLDPDEKKPALIDTRIDNRPIELRKPSAAKIFLFKAEMLKACREFFVKQGFIEINTPKIVQGGAEGGATLFSVDYFGKKALLAQSPQLYKQMLMASGFEKVWEIAPAFRAEKSNTTRHLSEFLSVDAELAFIKNENDVMKVLEKLLKHLLKRAGKLGIDVPKTKKFPRIKLAKAFKLIGEPKAGDLSTEQEKKLGEVMAAEGHSFYFVTDYPESDKPFYIMEKGRASRAFDLEMMGQEIASGGQREHRHGELVKRMKKLGVEQESFSHYLTPFRYGMPPHGGFGFGIERFIELMLKLNNIRETVLFPRDTVRLLP